MNHTLNISHIFKIDLFTWLMPNIGKFPAVTMTLILLTFIWSIKKMKSGKLEWFKLRIFFCFNTAFFKDCLKINTKIYLLRTPFHAHPCTNVIRIQMYFFPWLYSTINLSILNKNKIERIQAQYWNTRTAVCQCDFLP